MAIVAGMAGVRCRQPDAFFSIGAAGRLTAKGLPDAFQVRSSDASDSNAGRDFFGMAGPTRGLRPLRKHFHADSQWHPL